MKTLKLGDVTVKDKGNLGSDFYIDGHRIMWLNTMGEDELVRWLNNKPIATKNEIDCVSSGRIRPLPKRKNKKRLPPPAGEKKESEGWIEGDVRQDEEGVLWVFDAKGKWQKDLKQHFDPIISLSISTDHNNRKP